MTAITDFIEVHAGKMCTYRTYRSALNDYFSFIYKVRRAGRRSTAEELQQFENLSDRYIKEAKDGSRDVGRDLEKYSVYMTNTPAKTKILRRAGVIEFLKYHRIKIDEADIKLSAQRLGRKHRAQTKFKPLTPAIIRAMLNHTDIRGRAFILFLVSSGVRIGEALRLRLTDIDLTTTPAKVTIPEEITKTQTERITFISEEARSALVEFLKIRDQYIARAEKKRQFNGEKTGDNPYLFAMGTTTAHIIWQNAIKKAGFFEKDTKTNILVYNPHAARKFFRTHIAEKMNPDIAEALIGHTDELTQIYVTHTPEKIAEAYLSAMGSITIQELDVIARGKFDSMEEEIRRLREENEAMRTNQSRLVEQIAQKYIEEKIEEIAKLYAAEKAPV